MDVNSVLTSVKEKALFGLNWLRANGESKIIAISGLVGLLTFSSWSALFLAILVGGLYHFAKNKVPASMLNLVNIDFEKYAVNVVVGLVLASIFLFLI